MEYKKERKNPKYWRKIIVKYIIAHFKNKKPELDEKNIVINRVYKITTTLAKKRFQAFYIINVIVYLNKDFRCHLRLQASLPFRKKRKMKIKIVGEHNESSAFKSLKAIAQARKYVENKPNISPPAIF